MRPLIALGTFDELPKQTGSIGTHPLRMELDAHDPSILRFKSFDDLVIASSGDPETGSDVDDGLDMVAIDTTTSLPHCCGQLRIGGHLDVVKHVFTIISQRRMGIR